MHRLGLPIFKLWPPIFLLRTIIDCTCKLNSSFLLNIIFTIREVIKVYSCPKRQQATGSSLTHTTKNKVLCCWKRVQMINRKMSWCRPSFTWQILVYQTKRLQQIYVTKPVLCTFLIFQHVYQAIGHHPFSLSSLIFLYFAHTWFGLLHIPRLWALTPVIRFVVMRIFILVPLWLTLVIFMSSITVRSFHANDMSLCGWESLCVCVCVCTHGSQLVMWEADQSSKRALTTGNHPVLGPGQSTSAFLVNLMFNNSQWIKVF